MMAYFTALGAMCDRMLPAFAVALGMPADFFAPFFADEAHANLRFLHYPPQADRRGQSVRPGAAYRQQLYDRAGAHRGAGAGGAAAAKWTIGGEWFAPPIIPGTFLINLGNIMRRWSNDRFLSTPHGVLNESGTDRYSIAYFHSPNPTASSNACRAASAPTTRRATRRRSIATWCSNSTGPIISTRRATARTRRDGRRRPNDRSRSCRRTPAPRCAGVDLREPTIRRGGLNRAFVEHSVLVIRDQKLTAPQLLAAMQQFGEVLPQHNTKFALPECPQIHYISNQDPYPDGTRYIAGAGYHTDHSNAGRRQRRRSSAR